MLLLGLFLLIMSLLLIRFSVEFRLVAEGLDIKPRGRPPAGNTKGAAYGFRIHTQRQQGHRAPTSPPAPLYKTGFRRYNRNAMRRAFGCDGGSLLRCRGRVWQHPVLHCTFLCACNQIIPLSAKLSSRHGVPP